ncbi:protein HEADING DATE REPRESSOR 1-like [Rhodamnia argentea]|uniref:Protein HEADING DATE REPRESSOR 1-like n=1 Tax=Rhodamnia argentea TaxID=178133 RepID=A0ABM3H405_9MYRT|nr:protein HEADING DATE REPRESSOR 1-like [Rhodamnia argentea]XP_048131340.1 protein HEADING DATE REPRESSOR 1-like [Rhodamnia argentea]
MVQGDRPDGNGATVDGNLPGFSPAASSPPIFWKSRKRSVSGKLLNEVADAADKLPNKQEDGPTDENMQDSTQMPPLSERRKALFEPLEPVGSAKGRHPSNESLLPPPDFDAASYPRGWLIGKRRKLVNVDVVESMRRIAVQEMNRKDKEIDGLNEQLEEDARCLEHLQIQLLDEKSKRSEVERENKMLHDQVSMLMNMLDENESLEDVPDEP